MRKFPYGLKKNNWVAAVFGFVIASLSLLLWKHWFSGSMTMLLLTLFLAVFFLVIGFVKITANSTRAANVINYIWGFAAVALVIGASLPTEYTSNIVWKILLNYLCAIFVLAIIFAVTANWKVSVTITLFILELMLVINALVLSFRGKEFGPMDILSFKTALIVAGQYKIKITRRLFLNCIAFGAALLSQFSIPPMPRREISSIYLRLGALGVAVIAFLTIAVGSADIRLRSWSNEGSKFNGYLLNFCIGIREARLDAPEKYNKTVLDSCAERYDADKDTIPQGDMPNIIVIMDESFADFNIYNDKLSTNIPVTPFIDSLYENTIKGYAMTSVYGGNTSNEEYEFLTGHSMAFLPQHSVVYQQYISGEMYSIAHLLNSYGYTCMATHPYEATGWSRNVILPFLGFEKYTAQDDYPGENRIRELISDQEMFEYVLNCLYTKEKGPLFLMGITMQNHGGYEYNGADFEQTIVLEGYGGQYPLAEQYLSLIHETDRAVEYLLTELEKYEEDTIVLFYGDHYPGVELGLFEEMNGGALDTLDEQMLQYTIPFFVWANYDISPEFVERTSISYLSLYLLENAGFELPAYYRVLKDIQEVIPVINAFGYYSLENSRFIPIDEATGNEAEMLAIYEMLQYNNLIDAANRNDALFARYIE